jgi:hypothetical protein
MQVRHQVALHPAEPDHDRGREQVKHHLLGETALHPRGTGDDFGAHNGCDGDLRGRGERGARIAGDGDAAGADGLRLREGSDRKGRVSAGGERDDCIARHQLSFPESGASISGDVLGALDGPHQGAGATRHDPHHPLRGIAVGGRDLRSVEYPDAATRPGADVEPAPATLEREDEDVDGALHLRENPAHRLHGAAILGVDGV